MHIFVGGHLLNISNPLVKSMKKIPRNGGPNAGEKFCGGDTKFPCSPNTKLV